MSDRVNELSECYRDNVWPEYSRSIGLFPIPEYPEHDKVVRNGMWSSALDAILTTLRYIAPATLLTLFWGQQSLLYRILKHINLVIKSIIYSSDEQTKSVLKWLEEAGPAKVEHLDTVWRHGWILCRVLDGALPGACAGHPPTRFTLKHAQSIADHYLGVEPVFTHQELEADSLTKQQEWKLAQYLDRIRQAIARISPAVSKPNFQRTSPETPLLTLDYVARGAGLSAAQINNKAYFKIFATAQQSLDPGEITILIKGPRDTYGMTVIPPLPGKAQIIRQKLLGLNKKLSFTENALPLTHGATYLRNYGKNDMNKTFYIPKANYDIQIEPEVYSDHIKVGYIVPLDGKYEISIASRGHKIMGSPFSVTASKNILRILERDSFCLEDGEEIDIVDITGDKRVVVRIVDFITEKMLLRENGTYEKISDEEANILMSTENKEKSKRHIHKKPCTAVKTKYNYVRQFKEAVKKIKIMARVIKAFKESSKVKNIHQLNTKRDVPDVVNSTFNEKINEKFTKTIPHIIIPDSLTLILQTEKIRNEFKNEENNFKVLENEFMMEQQSQSIYPFHSRFPKSKNTPVTNDIQESIEITADDGMVKNLMEKESKTQYNNPFLDPETCRHIERPKTPVLKILTNDLNNRPDSSFIDSKRNFHIEDLHRSNEFINPFFTHNHTQISKISNCDDMQYPSTDFIIGAPVSFPLIAKAQSPEPDLPSMILISSLEGENKEGTQTYAQRKIEDIRMSIPKCSTPIIHNKDTASSIVNSTFHSIESNTLENNQYSLDAEDSCEQYILDDSSNNFNANVDIKRPNKDTWDSAYVSIDDNNSSPDSNENSVVNDSNKQNTPSCELSNAKKNEVIPNMGPAEREIWQSCKDLAQEIPQNHEEIKICKWEFKRPLFTPIIEESDRSLSTGLKESIESDKHYKEIGENTVKVAFTELNDIFDEYCPNSELSSTTTCTESDINDDHEVEYMEENNVVSVKSASEAQSDVTRQRTQNVEETISEVQVKVTEFLSASRVFPNKNMNQIITANMQSNDLNKSEIRSFGEINQQNLVLEKKKYWDEKIRVIEEMKSLQQKTKKKPSSIKRLNDSLSKRKGKQIAKKLTAECNSNEDRIVSETLNVDISAAVPEETFSKELKLVDKWKRYWDEKLEERQKQEINNNNVKYVKKDVAIIGNKSDINVLLQAESNSIDDEIYYSIPVKQEITEEVFKAFETSPKRFFGTSRKQIINKIDAFQSKENISDENQQIIGDCINENGIVSKRISLFHNLSQDEASSATRKINWIENNHKHDKIIYRFKTEEQCVEDPSLKPKVNHKRKLVNFVQASSVDIEKDTKPSSNQIKLKECNRNELKWLNKQSNNTNDGTVTVKNIAKVKLLGSKSEMDIFNKVNNIPENSEKHTSFEHLPQINVKNFISIYETVTKKASFDLDRGQTVKSPITNIEEKYSTQIVSSNCLDNFEQKQNMDVNTESEHEHELQLSNNKNSDVKQEIYGNAFNSFVSDNDIEIIENNPDEKSYDSTPEQDISTTDYKSRFKFAKEYFRSLEELQLIPEKKQEKLNECELMLNKEVSESPESTKEIPAKRLRKKVKSNSLPSSEFEKAWSQLQLAKDDENENEGKFLKISEKFNVDDLFNDVVGEGRLSRQGSFKGIPHKKAVLETFKSMENISNSRLSSYEIAMSQLTDFAKENNIKNVQTHCTEYPYLPTTEPSKYHSRCDTKASGLVSRRELLNNKPRRNSVPDLRMNAKFIANL